MGLMKLLYTHRSGNRTSDPGQTQKRTTTDTGPRQFLIQFPGHPKPMSDFPIKPIPEGTKYEFEGKPVPARQFSFQNGISRNCLCDSDIGLCSISPDSVDLVLTDPPYAIAKGQRLTKVGSHIQTEMTKYQHYDDFGDNEFEKLMSGWMSEFNRILHAGGNLLIFCGKEWVWLIQILAKKLGMEFRDIIIAAKLAPQPALSKKMLRSCFETCLWFIKPPLKATTVNQQSQDVCVNLATWNFLNHRQTKHPNEKPLPLMRWAVETFSDEGNLVVDAFGGSGVTGEACIQSGRKCILFEMNPTYWEEERDRLTAMLPMFGGSSDPVLPGIHSPEALGHGSIDTPGQRPEDPPPQSRISHETPTVRPSTRLQKFDEADIEW